MKNRRILIQHVIPRQIMKGFDYFFKAAMYFLPEGDKKGKDKLKLKIQNSGFKNSGCQVKFKNSGCQVKFICRRR